MNSALVFETVAKHLIMTACMLELYGAAKLAKWSTAKCATVSSVGKCKKSYGLKLRFGFLLKRYSRDSTISEC